MKMTIKSHGRIVELLFLFFLCIFLIIGTIIWGGDNKEGLYVLCVCLMFYCVCDHIVTGRTLIFDESGCTMKFYRYQRCYAWEDIVIRRKESRYPLTSYKHSKGVFFSIRPVYKPKWLDPVIYCTFFHPFACFFVLITEAECLTDEYRSSHAAQPEIYLVEEKEFFSKMKEWGVEIEE